MKKIFIIAAVVSLSMASCKKDLTCECVETDNAPGSVNSTTVVTYKKVKKKNVDENCVSYSTKETAVSIGTVSPYLTGEDCTLK
ncbi:MAG: hypothetical protein KBG47_00240 [Bacteroidia bacterium]|nr:hypothetical protein [Sphingobacteriaceae bacterium]MBK7311856.1 hypothetical protein [Sphingobacteriaceae bacterium]MBP9067904.1 hypothetical protein [Bacteroidia bacterium]